MMQAYTEEQRAELVQFNRAIIAQHEAYAVPESGWPEHVRLLVSSSRIALAALEAKPVGYGMQRKDNATFGSWLKPKHLVKENLIYRPAPLYLAQPVTATAIPSGWKLVPVEPTERMVIDGFESAPDEFWSEPEEWEQYQAMSGCEQAAHKARLCYAAMLAAAPEVE